LAWLTFLLFISDFNHDTSALLFCFVPEAETASSRISKASAHSCQRVCSFPPRFWRSRENLLSPQLSF